MTTGRWRRTQLRTRVLAGVLAVTVVALAAFDVVAVTQLRQYLLGRTDATLGKVLDLAAPHLGRLLTQNETGKSSPILQIGQGSAGYDYLAFIPNHGPTVVLGAATGYTPRLPADLAALAASGQPRTVANQTGTGQLTLRAAPAAGGTLVAAVSLDDTNRTVGRLQDIVIIGSLAAMVVIAAGVALVMRRGLRPLETMATQADRINAGDLTHHVGPDHATGEVGRLGAALNSMLARIETSIAERDANQELVRQFFADASHELRTPLASLRANAELYQQGALPQRSQVDEAMRRIALEAQRMSRLVDDMLRLARLDQHPTADYQPLDLTGLLQECLERAVTAQPQRTWHADIAPNLTVVGDEELLRRAVDNLIANVHTHTPADTTAALTAAKQGNQTIIEIADDGPGVPPHQLPRIFDRFYRANTTRPGSGLGLAIVTETAAAHGGSTTVAATQPHGLRITLALPSIAPPSADRASKATSNSHADPARL